MLVEFAEVLLRATSAGGARLFVNDRVDVALLAGAEGVHLPAGGLPISKVRALVGPDRWIGRSTHSPAEAQRAADEGADYVFLGPIWETPSHPGQGRERGRGRPGIGVTAIEQVRAVRIIAIGGITPDRVAHCLDAGAYGVAAITSLWRAPDPGSAAAEMLLLLKNT
jgi:thiamine-phosphate pyrophosphorylase